MASAADYAAMVGAGDRLPSDYQCEIFDWVLTGRGHGVAEAVAGSGKSTTLDWTCRLLGGRVLVLAFNKPIADQMNARLADCSNVEARTCNSFGNGALWVHHKRQGGSCKLLLEGRTPVKYRRMLKTARREIDQRETIFGVRLTEEDLRALSFAKWPRKACLDLLDRARMELLDHTADPEAFESELMALAMHHNIEIEDGLDRPIALLVQGMMRTGAANPHEIDFGDQIWLPVVLGLRPKQYDWVLVDECQDLSKAQLALVKKALRRGGRALFVGDRRQAIYGFAGADARSFEAIVESMDATLLPLSTCYRCPRVVVPHVIQHCPQFEVREDAPEGVERTIKEDAVAGEVKEGDLLLCRVNAPLVSLCLSLIADGVPATVRGRSIGQSLQAVARKAAEMGGAWADFGAGLDLWWEAQATSLRRRIADEDALEDALEAVGDRVACVRAVWGRCPEARSAEDLCDAIDDLFSDDRASVTLSSVHRAKGLEAERVFILKPSMLSRPRAKKSWQLEQERNLAYVAYTRCKQELIFVREERKSE